jgi:hypothetical protein
MLLEDMVGEVLRALVQERGWDEVGLYVLLMKVRLAVGMKVGMVRQAIARVSIGSFVRVGISTLTYL